MLVVGLCNVLHIDCGSRREEQAGEEPKEFFDPMGFGNFCLEIFKFSGSRPL